MDCWVALLVEWASVSDLLTNSEESGDDNGSAAYNRGPQQWRQSADPRMALEALRAQKMEESRAVEMHGTRFRDGLVRQVSALCVHIACAWA